MINFNQDITLKIGIKGRVEFIGKTKDGKENFYRHIDNLLTNGGRNLLAKAIVCCASTEYEYFVGNPWIAIGTGINPPTPTDIKLADELPDIDIPRKEVLPHYIKRQNNVAIFQATFGLLEGNPVGPGMITEAGLFWDNAISSRETGVLVARILVLPEYFKDNTSRLTVRWTFGVNRI